MTSFVIPVLSRDLLAFCFRKKRRFPGQARDDDSAPALLAVLVEIEHRGFIFGLEQA